MKAVLQRVSSASVSVGGSLVGEIGHGIMVLAGFGSGDEPHQLAAMAEKIVNLRIFSDERGRFHHSLKDVGGELLLVPQFTLYADASKGRRPEFFGAMEPAKARDYFERFAECFGSFGLAKVATGEFGASMTVTLSNEGPVTILLEN